ncbi:cellulose biosynthesis protein BcsG, partial [Morganella morganii]|uniref:cellulose biosynthesis protein BcsG n=1 Tax=Morganella morganii TaxID=582 RepID=UPI001F0A5C89
IIDQPSSYLAVSELVVRALDGKMFSEDSVNWQQYVANLPQSAAVSENANAIVIQYQGKPYHRSAQQLSGGVGAGGARPRRQNVQRGQRQLAA